MGDAPLEFPSSYFESTAWSATKSSNLLLRPLQLVSAYRDKWIDPLPVQTDVIYPVQLDD